MKLFFHSPHLELIPITPLVGSSWGANLILPSHPHKRSNGRDWELLFLKSESGSLQMVSDYSFLFKFLTVWPRPALSPPTLWPSWIEGLFWGCLMHWKMTGCVLSSLTVRQCFCKDGDGIYVHIFHILLLDMLVIYNMPILLVIYKINNIIKYAISYMCNKIIHT